jgi:hypothetical protein
MISDVDVDDDACRFPYFLFKFTLDVINCMPYQSADEGLS